MMSMYFRGLIGLSALVIATGLHAQQHMNTCGTIARKPLQYVNVDSILEISNRITPTTDVVKVFAHFTTNDSGSLPIVDIDTFMNRFANMQNFFAPYDICFLFMGSDVIYDSDLDTQFVEYEEFELLSHLVPDALNVFVHHYLQSGTTVGGGNAYDIPNNYLSLSDGALYAECCTGTLAHEAGHCLGLYHTFQWSWGTWQIKEQVDRIGACKNCQTQGDLLCDTPADPHELLIIDGTDTSFFLVWDHMNNCVLDTTVLDSCGVAYDPDASNIMSYFPDSCHTHFTVGQGIRCKSFLSGELNNLVADQTITLSVNATNTSGQFTYGAVQTISFQAPSLIYSQSAKVIGAAGNSITVNPGTTFAPTSGYTLLSAHETCQ